MPQNERCRLIGQRRTAKYSRPLFRVIPCVLSLLAVSVATACRGGPLATGETPAPPEQQARALFQNYTFDTYPQTPSHHTARVCDVVAVRVDFTPRLQEGTEATISLVNAAGLATAELGQTGTQMQTFKQNAIADGSLGFGFHFLSGRSANPAGSIDILIEVPGRPPQRIHVKIIK